jgi:adenosylcobyric acid synthase
MKKWKPIMFVGTGSDVGKSVINAAFCRIFKQDGHQPAPFKAQNMSLNSYATPDGLEIGRAQAVQAEACGLPSQAEMNPILLKPINNTMAQVVLNGKPLGNKTAREYFMGTDRDYLFGEAMRSLRVLQEKFNPVVIEGAGSISEMNLWDKDIVNMRVALAAGAATFLIADIDRGGVFASLYGSVHLLPPKERELIKGIIINKFRGDLSLFYDGKQILEKICGKPVVGIIPYFHDIHIEPEDAVAIDLKNRGFQQGKINVAVVLLKHMSNFTDFSVLEQVPEVNLYYTSQPHELNKADIAIIPGSKSTIADMQHLLDSGLAATLQAMHQQGKAIYGICGGFQIMGQEIHDPHLVESNEKSIMGLGILPVKTTLSKNKKTEQCKFTFLENTQVCTGYEIHMGITECTNSVPLCRLANGTSDGYFKGPKTWGTYIHGIFDNHVVLQAVLHQVNPEIVIKMDYRTFKEENYDKLAQWVRQHVDMEYIYQALENQ